MLKLCGLHRPQCKCRILSSPCHRYACEGVNKLLVGNKCDLANKRVVDKKSAEVCNVGCASVVWLVVLWIFSGLFCVQCLRIFDP